MPEIVQKYLVFTGYICMKLLTFYLCEVIKPTNTFTVEYILSLTFMIGLICSIKSL